MLTSGDDDEDETVEDAESKEGSVWDGMGTDVDAAATATTAVDAATTPVV